MQSTSCLLRVQLNSSLAVRILIFQICLFNLLPQSAQICFDPFSLQSIHTHAIKRTRVRHDPSHARIVPMSWLPQLIDFLVVFVEDLGELAEYLVVLSDGPVLVDSVRLI